MRAASSVTIASSSRVKPFNYVAGGPFSITGHIGYTTNKGSGTWDNPEGPLVDMHGVTISGPTDFYSKLVITSGDEAEIVLVNWYTRIVGGEWEIKRDNDLYTPYTMHPYAPTGIPFSWIGLFDGNYQVRAEVIFTNGETQDFIADVTITGQDEGTDPDQPNPTDLGLDLRNYINQPGDQWIVLPNRTYVFTSGSGASRPITAPHPATAGQFGGYLILQAQTKDQCIIDLDGKDLTLDNTTSRVLFIGFKFINGRVMHKGVNRIRYWYCDFTYPADVFFQQYMALGKWNQAYTGTIHDECAHPGGYVKKPGGHSRPTGNVMTLPEMCNRPTPIYLQQTTPSVSPVNQFVELYACDIHDCGDDGIQTLNVVEDLTMIGVRMWNVDKWVDGDLAALNTAVETEYGTGVTSGLVGGGGKINYDPGGSFGSGSKDWYHNDGWQLTVSSLRTVITNCWIGQKLQLQPNNGQYKDSVVNDTWIAGSTTIGVLGNTLGVGKILNCTMNNIRAFGNGQRPGNAAPPTYNASHDSFRTDFDGSTQYRWPQTRHQPGTFELVATNVDLTYPSGVTHTNGILDDINQIKDHPENPANVWRTAWRYQDWKSYFGWS